MSSAAGSGRGRGSARARLQARLKAKSTSTSSGVKAIAKDGRYLVLSFNCLAPCWAKPEWYPGIDAKLLQTETRMPKILEAITSRKPDLVCLQEVDAVSYPLFKKALDALGYDLSALSHNLVSDAKVQNGVATACRKTIPHWFRRETYEVVGAMVTIFEDELEVVNVHLDRQEHGGKEQAINMLWCSRCVQRRVIIGDLNIKKENLHLPCKGIVTVTPHNSLCSLVGTEGMALDHALVLSNQVNVFPVAEKPHGLDAKAKDLTQKLLEVVGSDHYPVAYYVGIQHDRALASPQQIETWLKTKTDADLLGLVTFGWGTCPGKSAVVKMVEIKGMDHVLGVVSTTEYNTFVDESNGHVAKMPPKLYDRKLGMTAFPLLVVFHDAKSTEKEEAFLLFIPFHVIINSDTKMASLDPEWKGDKLRAALLSRDQNRLERECGF